MQLPDKSQSIYAQIKMLEPTMRYLKDSIAETEFNDLELLSEFSLVCMHLKSILAKIEHTSRREKYGDSGI